MNAKTTIAFALAIVGATDLAAQERRPFGEWQSPITSDVLVSESVRLGEPRIDDDTIYWVESRPQEKGRSALVARDPGGETRDVLSSTFNVRSRVHEYGGGAYAVRDGTVVFVDFAAQRIHVKRPGEAVRAVTPEAPTRYADFVFADEASVYAVREEHVDDGEPINTIVHVVLENGHQRVVVSGNNFYSNPRISPDGRRLAWLTWNHPDMPWDETELWVGRIGEDGSVSDAKRIAGGDRESIFQPEWLDSDTLVFVSDRTGWWNLYTWRDGETAALYPRDAEFGEPQWVFGQSTYAVLDAVTLIATYEESGRTHLGTLNVRTREWSPIDVPHTSLGMVRAAGSRIVYLGGAPDRETELVSYDLASGKLTVVKRSSKTAIDDDYISVAEAIAFPSADGRTAHAFYYAPKNPRFAGPEGEKPPLLVFSHGGPTGATGATLNPSILYWTSRGIAVVDVNYGGSTGYGRAYRELLRGHWGIVDVEDCVHAAQYLVEAGRVDGERLAIRGGSAGGYTTLAALAFTDVFDAGASYFGVADLELLAKDTHKFESRYLDSLVGAYPAEKAKYEARSPIHHLDQLDCPVIFFQGLDDKIVPPNQSELMHEALKDKGIPTAYLAYEGEGHGFRRAENIKQSLDAELYFYGKVFGFTPADNIEPVNIANM